MLIGNVGADGDVDGEGDVMLVTGGQDAELRVGESFGELGRPTIARTVLRKPVSEIILPSDSPYPSWSALPSETAALM